LARDIFVLAWIPLLRFLDFGLYIEALERVDLALAMIFIGLEVHFSTKVEHTHSRIIVYRVV
jgi:hypothetical protein